MKLTKYQNNLLENTDKIMAENNLKERDDYDIIVYEEGNLHTGSKKVSIIVQFNYNEKVVKELKKLEWKIAHKYYGNGNPRILFEDDGYPFEYDEGIEMIQMVFK